MTQLANEFTIVAVEVTTSSAGRDHLTVGGGPNDDISICQWDPGRLTFERQSDGWLVTDGSGVGLRVNGIVRTQWRIANYHAIEGHGASIEVHPEPQPAGHRRAGEKAQTDASSPKPETIEPPLAAGDPTGPVPFSAPDAAAKNPSTPPSPPQRVAASEKLTPSWAVPAAHNRNGPEVFAIGRATNNSVVLDDLRVAPHHAEIRVTEGGPKIFDLGSRGGTFINGQRVDGSAKLLPGQTIAFGSSLLSVVQKNGQLQLVDTSEQLSLQATAASIEIDGTTIVQSASLAIEPGEMVGILGPSGSGKSTLVRALSGGLPPARGSITINHSSLYGDGSGLQQQIGYVPQDDILHHQLQVKSALAHAADLRFPDSTPDSDRQDRVNSVIVELGLQDEEDSRIDNLSGGQRKRVNVATELLTAPSLLFLDEPTSGLDPGYEKEVMQLLRRLADGGRTIVVVTHSLQSLDVCDKLLIMAKGGQQAFFGSPADALHYFGVDSLADIFIELEQGARNWQQEWDNVAPPMRSVQSVPNQNQRAIAYRSPWAQFLAVARRYIEVLTQDPRQMSLTLAQGPLIALLMITVMGTDHLARAAGTSVPSKAPQVLLALTLGAVYVGASAGVREIVKELPILRRERSAGLGLVPYVSSKAAVLGALTLAQSFVLVAIGAIRQAAPVSANVLGDGRIELFVGVAFTGIASLAMGLFVSAAVRQQDKAMLVLPVLLFAQFVLSGVSFATDHSALNALGALMPARWGFAAVSSTVDLPKLNANCPDRLDGCPSAWSASAEAWGTSITILGTLTLVYLAAAVAILAWREQRHRL